MTAGPGKAAIVTGIVALSILGVLAIAAGIASQLELGSWVYTLAGLLAMLCWGAHVVGIGFAVEALRSGPASRKTGLWGLILNGGSLAFWLLLIPLAVS